MTSQPMSSYNIKKEQENDQGSGSGVTLPPGFNNNNNSSPRSITKTTPPTKPVFENPARKRAKPGDQKLTITLTKHVSGTTTVVPAPTPPKSFCLEPTVESIKAKYGDIEKDCDLKSEELRKGILSCICNVLKKLHHLKIEEFKNVESLEKYYDVVQDAEKLKIDVKWFRQQLDRIKEAIKLNVEAERLIAERNVQKHKFTKQQNELEALNIRKQIVEKELEALNARRQKLNKELGMGTVAIGSLDRDIALGKTKFGNFKCRGMLDGLF